MKITIGRLLIILPLLSALFFALDYIVFKDQNNITNWILNSLGFVFIEVLLVTVFLHSILERRERDARLSKLSNLIGLFFTESGMDMLDRFLAMNRSVRCESCFAATLQWTDQDFDNAIAKARSVDASIQATGDDLDGLRDQLRRDRDFLVRLMENPNLFEHERFTDLLLAILHVDEELKHRKDLHSLPPGDVAHLNNDCLRAFQLLIVEWLEHMRHLKATYPYLYSLAVRINPLSPKRDAVVKA
jgi:hypothetical protein